jgi:hypothetical protein
MGALRQSSSQGLKSVALAMGPNQNLGLVPRTVKHVEAQACRPSDKAQSSCRPCVELVMEREESSNIPALLAQEKELRTRE